MPNKTRSVMSNEDVSLVLRMHAEGHIPSEIIRHLDKNNIRHPTPSAIWRITKAKCHQAEIEAYREDYYSRIKEVPIAHKRTRLEDREDLRKTLKKMFKKLMSKEGDINKKQFKMFLAIAKRLDEVLTGAQDEMEKRPGTVVALTQNFGDRELTMEELLVEERNITGRIGELRDKGISLPDRTSLNSKEDKEG